MSAFGAATVGGAVHPVLWDALVKDGSPVGSCPDDFCPGLVYGQPARQRGRIRWYEGECRTCHREILSPNGKLAERAFA